jgi:1,4-alpha-glucan branching enzyme
MGWMHDTLEYLANDPVYRNYHHDTLTFRNVYAFSENYVLPLSHDEVVHLKGSLLFRMPGDNWQKFANLRLLFGYQIAQPGKKLIFMGGEFGQWHEWNHEASLDWHLLEDPTHAGVQRWVKDLNEAYAREPALHELDVSPNGFEWVDRHDAQHSVISFLRKGLRAEDDVLVVLNFTPVPRVDYRVGIPSDGFWREFLNSDGIEYGGSGVGNLGGAEARPEPAHGRPYSLWLTLPPLGVLFLRQEPR